MGCGKACVPCNDHHIMFAHAIGKPHTYGCPLKIVESSLLGASFSEDPIELSPEVIHYLHEGICKGSRAFWP